MADGSWLNPAWKTNPVAATTSILQRPLRSPSRKNEESWERQEREDAERRARSERKYQKWEGTSVAKGTYAARGGAPPEGHDQTKQDRCHGEILMVHEAGLRTAFNKDVDSPGGKRRVQPSPFPPSPERPLASPLPRPPSASRKAPVHSPPPAMLQSPGQPDPASTPRSSGKRQTGHALSHCSYNTITHDWIVPPTDPRYLDREATPCHAGP